MRTLISSLIIIFAAFTESGCSESEHQQSAGAEPVGETTVPATEPLPLFLQDSRVTHTESLPLFLQDPKVTHAELAALNKLQSGANSQQVNFPANIPQSDAAEVLDAILDDVLNNPKNEKMREHYGTPGDGLLGLVDYSNYGVKWPAWYSPSIAGYTVRRVNEFAPGRSAKPKLIGVQIDKFSLTEIPTESLFDAPIAIKIVNVGGGRVHGGRTIFYVPCRSADKWVVRFRSARS